ncbi:histidine kinase [Chitinophaga caeni]|uniref:histidine kinase n=1 Tax=Chitinophaga caeni TaxID=2029983 RepID=A0A291R112_9BACT|nr:HAMP domain-containing sensor histidine kinase [Chitinophaga caeni]ATL49865.1 histidine kinase [Chitinophaga caeni]
MKPLLSKATKPFLIYVLIVLVVSVPIYYLVVDAIWKAELDEHNKIIAEKTAYGLGQLQLTADKLGKSIELWNSIQPGTSIRQLQAGENKGDSTYTVEKQRVYSKSEIIDRFRCLNTTIAINGKPYRFSVETNIEESVETIAVIAAVTIFLFLLIVTGLLLLTRRLSSTVWKPFHNTLDTLKTFQLNSHANIEFEQTSTLEFEELNASLAKLIDHSVATYKSQKEFTENASHELQTPLAVLKNKLDILLQSDDLTERQYNIAEDMNKALIRSARINKNLLLLAKIDNNQFINSENIVFDPLVLQCIDGLKEHFEQKHLSIETSTSENIRLKGNSSLTEILINNLLLNAVRYTQPGGRVKVRISGQGIYFINSGESPLNRDLLFKRFTRLSFDKNGNGSGLGLSIVREISRFHGWQVNYSFENGFHIFAVIP